MKFITPEQKQETMRCYDRARQAGLDVPNLTIEMMVSNKEFVEMRAKGMIPTLYDHWLQDVEVYRGLKEYEIFQHNPFECVINAKPHYSFYNETNAEWLNTLIYYHVAAHIDFFRNNVNFAHTWNTNFMGKSEADSELITKYREEHGRWADYAIEFAISAENLCSSFIPREKKSDLPPKVEYLFHQFLQLPDKPREKIDEYLALYNSNPNELFLISTVNIEFPEFEAFYEKNKKAKPERNDDVLQFVLDHSKHLKNNDNAWIRDIISIIRDTSLYFQPQQRTKIMNEGWASKHHEELTISDDTIHQHQVGIGLINSSVMAMPRVGLNPYALGKALYDHIEEKMNRGGYSEEYQKLSSMHEKEMFNQHTGKGRQFLFFVRKHYSDFTFLNEFIDQEFVNKHNLAVIGERYNRAAGVKEYYIKSRNSEDYKKDVLDKLYHPPHITASTGVNNSAGNGSDTEQKNDRHNGTLFLEHHFERKELYQEAIPNALIGLEFLWGDKVVLRTTEFTEEYRDLVEHIRTGKIQKSDIEEDIEEIEPELEQVVYVCKNKKVKREVLTPQG